MRDHEKTSWILVFQGLGGLFNIIVQVAYCGCYQPSIDMLLLMGMDILPYPANDQQHPPLPVDNAVSVQTPFHDYFPPDQ